MKKLLFLVVIATIVVVIYYKPIPVFSVDHALKSIALIDDAIVLLKTPDDFRTVTRDKLLFLLKGIYLSQVSQFSGVHKSFNLSMHPIESGHVAEFGDALFIFLRPSFTHHDFLNDLCLFTKQTKRGRVYRTPLRLAERVLDQIEEKYEDRVFARIIVTGMSLGASIAAVVAEHLSSVTDVHLVAFAPYCVGDKAYNKAVREAVKVSWLIKNTNDVVCNAFPNSIGTKILFDYDRSDRTQNHCDVVAMISAAVDGTEKIDDRTFYFSDEV